MTASTSISPQVSDVLNIAKRLTAMERLLLAKLLLDGIVSDELEDESDWQALSLSAFEKDWDNPDDAIYDNWRELYDVPARLMSRQPEAACEPRAGRLHAGVRRDYSANISAKTSSTAFCVSVLMRPSRVISRVLSTVRTWSRTICPSFP